MQTIYKVERALDQRPYIFWRFWTPSENMMVGEELVWKGLDDVNWWSFDCNLPSWTDKEDKKGSKWRLDPIKDNVYLVYDNNNPTV